MKNGALIAVVEMFGKGIPPALCVASCVYLAAEGKPKWLALGTFLLVLLWRTDREDGGRS